MSSEVRVQDQEKETGRIEAFSDGVFAILKVGTKCGFSPLKRRNL